jgi:hypothetical protein
MSLSYVKELLKDCKIGEAVAFDGKCHRCKADVRVVVGLTDTGDVSVVGGGYFHHPLGVEQDFLLCESCFTENPVLDNFMPTEVYSRVCGYLRPVKQWNKGKQSEFAMRKDFKDDAWTE